MANQAATNLYALNLCTNVMGLCGPFHINGVYCVFSVLISFKLDQNDWHGHNPVL